MSSLLLIIGKGIQGLDFNQLWGHRVWIKLPVDATCNNINKKAINKSN